MNIHLTCSLLVVLVSFVFGQDFQPNDCTQIQKIILENATIDDLFGQTLDILGNTIAIGAYKQDTDEKGAAYIYSQDNGKWNLEQILRSPSPAEGAHFGWDVALWSSHSQRGYPPSKQNSNFYWDSSKGEANLLFVSELDTGQVYIYHKDNSQWKYWQNLDNSHSISNQTQFGYFLEIKGNVLYVGAPGENAVYIWQIQSNLTVTYSGIITSNVTGFGNSITAWGDLLAVGADANNTAFVYKQLSLQSQLLPDGQNTDHILNFGSGSAIFNDWLVVAAFKEASALNDAGAIYTYNSSLVQQQRIVPEDITRFDHFGESIVIVNENSMLVGAHRHSPDTINEAGVVYFYTRSGSNWTAQSNKLTANDATPYAWFGRSLAFQFFDSELLVVVGANQDSNNPTNTNHAGATYIFSCPLPSKSKKGLSDGEIAAIVLVVVGSFFVLLGLMALAVFKRRRDRKFNKMDENQTEMNSPKK